MRKKFNLHAIITVFILIISFKISYGQDLPVMAVVDNRSVDVDHIAKSMGHKTKRSMLRSAVFDERR